MLEIAGAAWTFVKGSRIAQIGLTIVAVLAIGAGLYLAGYMRGGDKAEGDAAKEVVKEVGTERKAAEDVERRIDDKEDRALIECMRRNNC